MVTQEEQSMDGRCRVVVAAVGPSVESGRYAVKRTLGDEVGVWADLVIDGHDQLAAVLTVRGPGAGAWREFPMRPAGPRWPDRWAAEFTVDALGTWEFAVEAWVDRFASWRHGFERKFAAGQEPDVELRIGEALVRAAAARAAAAGAAAAGAAADARALTFAADGLVDPAAPPAARAAAALSPGLSALCAAHPDRALSTRAPRPLPVLVERERARFTSWYEFFPRSLAGGARHGTLRDAAAMLPYVASLGFDVVYLPPIHPIGRTFRKGPNNSLTAGPGDPGSPWAIGAAEGGHTELHPELGTLDDFAALVARARELGMEIALDVAFQAAPDHPWVSEHPGWFVRRPDGSFQYAENPPKKYQDVYPFDFGCDDWRGLWAALADVFLTWASRGVRVFRVDNPHTKPVPFWRWCLAEVRGRYPDAVFLAEAFTRPLMLHELAKVGFSQSYTYFTWRTSKRELEGYLRELRGPELSEYLRPSFWPNTPDILPENLQVGGRASFALRLVLAATLAASYGIYGPSFELCDAGALPDREEYRDSEKYQLRAWDLAAPQSLRHLIARVNRIRREHPALQRDEGLAFHRCDDDALIVYSKTHRAGDAVLVVVNLDPFHKRSGWVELDAAALGLPPEGSYQVHDLISDARYLWSGARNYVELDPASTPAHVFVIRRQVRREQNFDYFL